MAEKTLDLFWFLKEIDKKNFEVYASLSDEQKKEVSTYMLLRWLSSTSNIKQIEALGRIGTSCVFELDKHPELLVKLFAVLSKDGPKRYTFIRHKLAEKESLINSLVCKQWGLSSKHAKDALMLLSNDDIIEIANEQGLQNEELKALKKELKERI